MPSFRWYTCWWNQNSDTVAKQEKLMNCGTKAADVLDKPLSLETLMRIQWIFWCIWNCNLWLHNAYQFRAFLHLLPFGRNLKFVDPQFWGFEELREGSGGRESRKSKDHTRLPNTSQYNFVLYMPPFDRNSNVKIRPPISTPLFGGLRWTRGVENGTNRNLVPIFLCDF